MTAASPVLGRRTLLRGAVGLGAAAALHLTTSQGAEASEVAGTDPVVHLLRRATYGVTPELLAEVRQSGAHVWLAQQLFRSTVPDPDGDAIAARWPDLSLSAGQLHAKYSERTNVVMYALREAHLARAAWSRRQVLEVMVDFWSNHLNVQCPDNELWDVRHSYDRDVIRRYALGRFSDMLVASARHPAMLRYLDNGTSSKNKPNENYARESLELHTVGVGAGYTEHDVKQAALLLTGMYADVGTGEYRYVPSRHHVGPVQVMGFSHPNGSAADGEAVQENYLRWLARHPATAEHLAYKLAQRFVADEPPAELVRTLADTYLQGDTRISLVLQRLFLSREFAGASGLKVRTPFEDVVATVRALGIGPDADGGTAGISALFNWTTNVGQAPLAWAAPNGYPQVAAAWSSSSSTVARWNMHASLALGNTAPALAHPPRSRWLPDPLPATYGALVDAMTDGFVLPRLGSEAMAAVCTFFNATPETSLRANAPVVGARLPHLVALLLNAPDFFLR